MSQYDIAIRIAGQLEGSFRNAIRGAQSGLSGLGVSGKIGTAAIKGVGIAAKATAAALAGAGTAAAGLGMYAVNVGKNFEAQMSTVQSISGATGEELDILTKKAKEMGANTSFSASEAGQAMEYMAMAGWKTEDMVRGIGGIMNLAAASGEDLAMTSDIVTDALTAFGMSAKESGHFADVLAAASSNANTNVAMLGESFQYVAPMAGALGISAEDTSFALGLMANSGIKASSAGTALRTGLTNMVKPTKKMATYMERYNIAMVENEDGSINLRETMIDLRAKMDGLSESEQAAAASAIFGKEASAGWLAIINSSEQDFEKLANAIDDCNGKAEEMAKIKLDNLEGDITYLKSAAEAFGISLYDNMKGPLRGWVKFAKSQVEILQNALDGGGIQGLASAVGDVLANSAVKIGDAAPDFINAAADIVESLIDGIDNKSSELGDSMARLVMALFQAAIRLIPRMIVAGGKLMVGLAVGIVRDLPMLKDTAIEIVSYFWKEIKSAFGNHKDTLGKDELKPINKLLLLVPALVAGFAVFDGAGGAVKGFIGSMKGLKGASKVMPLASKEVSTASKTMSSAAKNILGVGAGFALAAAGVWLLVDAAKRIAEAGPEAGLALVAMFGGIVGLMAVTSKLAPALQSSQQGLIAFGAAMLMTAGAMALLSYAAIQLAEAGPGAVASFVVLVGAIAGLVVIVGMLGKQLAIAAPGLFVFGAAMLLVAGAMALLTHTAITLAAAGTPAIIALIALAVGVIAFGAAAGALAPLLMAGGVALVVFGAGLLTVSVAAVVAAAALLIISIALPTLSKYGTSGAVAIVALGSAITVFSAGAVIAGAGAGAAAIGLGALAVAAVGASLAFTPLAIGMTAVAKAIKTISGASAIFKVDMQSMKNIASSTVGFFTGAFKSGIRSAFKIDITSSGRNMMQGFVNGISQMKKKVQETASKIASQAAKAVNSVLKIHSPSRLMIESGQYTGEGFAIGMQNRTSDVQVAAEAMTQPIQTQGQQMRDMNAPQASFRSNVIGETIDNLSGVTTNNTTTNQALNPTFNFNPTYVIEGNADKEVLQDTAKISRTEFEKMMNEWLRQNKRVSFA